MLINFVFKYLLTLLSSSATVKKSDQYINTTAAIIHNAECNLADALSTCVKRASHNGLLL